MATVSGKKHTQNVLARKQLSAEPVVIFVASSTPEKVRDFQLIAEAKHYPIIFEDVHKLVSAFHHVDETGAAYEENAKAKTEGVGIEQYRSGEYKERIDRYLAERNIPANAKVFIATEDSGFRLPKEIWDKFDKSGIPQEVLDRITPGKNLNFTGPGVETAPVISAVLGDFNFMKRIYKAAVDLKIISGEETDKTIITRQNIIQNSVLHLEPVRVNFKETLEFPAEKSNTLIFPPLSEIKPLLSKRKITNYDYLTGEGLGKTFGELAGDGIKEHSVRAQIAKDIYNTLFKNEIQKGYKPNYKSSFRTNPYQSFKIGTVGNSEQQNTFTDFIGIPYYSTKFATVHPDQNQSKKSLKKSDYELLSSIEHTLSASDSVILFPDMHEAGVKKPTPEEAKLAELMKIYTLSSLVVNKQINPRDADKPIIILNHDGSWDNAIKIHNSLSNLAMTKEDAVAVPRKFMNPKGLDYKSNGYFEVIGTPNGTYHKYEDTISTAMEILDESRKGYFAGYPAESNFFEQGDERKGDGKFKVAVFCSASSENEQLNKAVHDLSYDLAMHDFGIVYGGGDRYTMGAVLDGVRDWREHIKKPRGKGEKPFVDSTYIAGYSTKPLLKSETKLGAFSPDLSYAKQDKDIYQRMADMLDASNVVVAAPGGAGTVQEWAAALILNHYRELEGKEKRPVVFFDPELNNEQRQVWKVALKAVLGEKNYKLLASDKESPAKTELSEKFGIYIEKTEKGLQDRISKLRDEQHQTTRFVDKVAGRTGDIQTMSIR